jgi:hypothetical protein
MWRDPREQNPQFPNFFANRKTPIDVLRRFFAAGVAPGHLAMKRGSSVDFTDYWRRHIEMT